MLVRSQEKDLSPLARIFSQTTVIFETGMAQGYVTGVAVYSVIHQEEIGDCQMSLQSILVEN